MNIDELAESNRRLKEALTRVSLENVELKNKLKPKSMRFPSGATGNFSGFYPYGSTTTIFTTGLSAQQTRSVFYATGTII